MTKVSSDRQDVDCGLSVKLLGVEDEVGAGVDGEEAVVGFGFGGEYADCVLVVDKVV